MAQATFQNGNREITVTTGSVRAWVKEGMAREYIDLISSDKKRQPISSLYRIIEGGTRDDTVKTASGAVYGYQLGICCDSKTKRAAAAEAVQHIVDAL